MSWKQAITTGTLVGSSLGFIAYTTLSNIGAQLMIEDTYQQQTLVEPSTCGLEPETSCVVIDTLVYESLVTPTEEVAPVEPVVVEDHTPLPPPTPEPAPGPVSETPPAREVHQVNMQSIGGVVNESH